MRRVILWLCLICLLLGGCVPRQAAQPKHYTATFLTLFDTVTTIVGPAASEEEFQVIAQQIHDDLEQYHRLFDIYNAYEGLTNLKIVNDSAGIAPVAVDPAIFQLLSDCKSYYQQTGGRVNVMLGSVLSLWHEARNDGIRDPMNARLPDPEALSAAAAHTDMDSLILDEGKGTVYISDPLSSLDVGAVAKGWACQRAAENAPKGLLISVGGNVCATGPKTEAGDPWVIGIQNPDGGDYLHTIYVSGGCVVTSGDYQRTYTVAGEKYHHIIDPDTLMPGTLWRSISVVCPDSALADALSTALFLLPQAEGQALLDACGAEALWVDKSGQEYMSPGFQEILRT